MSQTFEIVWEKESIRSLLKIHAYIKDESSIEQANRVIETLLILIKKASNMPRKHSIEPMLQKISGEYRYIPKWSYKIIFEVEENRIVVLDIIHTSRNPSQIELLKKGKL